MTALNESPAKGEVRSVIRFLQRNSEVHGISQTNCCPDLAPSDFYLFLHPEKHLAGKKFDDDDEVQEEDMMWFKEQTADFYDSGIRKLVPRLHKCLDNAGDYVEK